MTSCSVSFWVTLRSIYLGNRNSEWHHRQLFSVQVMKWEYMMATAAKAIVTFALSEYKQLLDRHAVLLQLLNTVDKEDTKCRMGSRLPYFDVFKKCEVWFTVYTGGRPSLKVNKGKNPQIGNLTSWAVPASNLEPGNFNFRVQRERSILQTRKERATLVPLLLCHVCMNCDGREDLLHQQMGQSDTMLNCFHKDHHLKINQTSHGKSGNRGCTQRCGN